MLSMNVKANELVIKEPIQFGWVEQEFELAENATNRHIIELNESGKLDFLLSVDSGLNYFRLYDQHMVLLYENFLLGSEDVTQRDIFRIDLMAGIYYLDYECTNAAGNYWIRAEFTSAENNERESNNTKTEAMKLENKKEVNGFLTTELGIAGGKKSAMSDTIDYYYFDLTKDQQVKIYFQQKKGGTKLQLLNSKMKILREMNGGYDKESIDTHLPAGRYYILITAGTKEAGAYTLLMEKGYASPEIGKTFYDPDIYMSYKITSMTEDGITASVVKVFDSIEVITILDEVTIGTAQVKVTAIAKNAFSNCYRVKRVEIGDNVTSIGASAFSGCTTLEKVSGGKNVKTIGSKAFYGCTALTQMREVKNRITLYNVKSIGKQAFWGCTSVKRIAIPSRKLERISASAYGKCKGVSVVTIASGKIKTIGINAFNGCEQLKRVTMKTRKLKTVGKYAHFVE